jgi:hypothetical protein
MSVPYQQFIGKAFYKPTLSIQQNQPTKVRTEKGTLSNDQTWLGNLFAYKCQD